MSEIDYESTLIEAQRIVNGARQADYGIIGIAIDKPWNQDWNYRRARSFNECLNIISQISDPPPAVL